MNNNKKIISIIEKSVHDASNYINIHGKHYLSIFKLFNKNNSVGQDCVDTKSKKMFNDFVKCFIRIQMFLRKKQLEKKNTIIKLLFRCKKIFDNLSELDNLSKHQKIDIVTIKVYIKVLLKLFKKVKFSNNAICNNLTVIKNKCNQISTPTKENSDSNNTCENNDNINNNTCENSNNANNNNTYQNNDNINNICINNSINVGKILNPLEILKKNKKYLSVAVTGLKNIIQLLTIIETIFYEIKMDYLQKINCYNLYDGSLQVCETDVEFNEKLLSTSYDQLNSLISNKQNLGTNIFNDKFDTQPIEAFLEDGKTFILCTIDNFRIKKSDMNGFDVLLVDVGKKRYYVKYLKINLDNASAILIMKENFNSLKTILYAIQMNKKLILYWLNMLKEYLR